MCKSSLPWRNLGEYISASTLLYQQSLKNIIILVSPFTKLVMDWFKENTLLLQYIGFGMALEQCEISLVYNQHFPRVIKTSIKIAKYPGKKA